MTYNFNGKAIRIPDDEIAQSVTALGISRDEAIEMWLDDNGYTTNEEQEALDEKASAIRATSAKAEKKERKPRAPKAPDEVKRSLIQLLAEALTNAGYNAEVTNVEREISFTIGDESFGVTLTKHRPPKKA